MTKAFVLPADLPACQTMIRDLAERDAKLETERDAALQLAFRKKIERYTADPKQFVLDFGDTPDVVDAGEGTADALVESVTGYERRKHAEQQTRNQQLPAHLPRYEAVLESPEAARTCPTHGERKQVGMDWQETHEVVPSKLIVRRAGIPKYACHRAPEYGVVEAARPVGLVDGNKYDTSIAAEVAVAKYAYHTPVYVFAACGWTPARSTLQNVLKAPIHHYPPIPITQRTPAPAR